MSIPGDTVTVVSTLAQVGTNFIWPAIITGVFANATLVNVTVFRDAHAPLPLVNIPLYALRSEGGAADIDANGFAFVTDDSEAQ